MSELQTPVRKETSFKDRIRDHLAKTVRYYLSNLDDGRLPRDAFGTLHVLSIGCHNAFEAKPIIDTFPNAHYRGIDIDASRIEEAERVNQDIPKELAEFSVEDAKKLHDAEKDKYGLVILRHPQVLGKTESVEVMIEGTSESAQEWRAIIAASIAKTVPRGFLFATTDSDSERDRIISSFEANNVQVLFYDANRASEFEEPLFRDSIIIIGQK